MKTVFRIAGWLTILFDLYLLKVEYHQWLPPFGFDAFNATNTMRQTRGRWLDLFADYNARIEIVYVELPFENLLRQNKARNKAVPEPVIRKLAEKCEPPTWIECHRLLMIEG